MSDEVILYDLPSKQGTCWSLNPWKVRLVLNYKGIPYKTEWTEYPDLEPKFKEFGIPPNEAGFRYTSPTVRLPDGTYLMESKKIVAALEKLYPTPPLYLDSPYNARVDAFMPRVHAALRPIFMPLVAKTYLNPPSRDYFVASREKTVGMSLDKYAEGAEDAFNNAKPLVKELGEMLRENPDGPFLQGKTPSYADFVLVGWITMLDGIGWMKGRFFDVEGGAELAKLQQACAKWTERKD